MRLRSSAFTSGFRLRPSAVYASCTEALRKLTLPDDLVVWTMPSGFLEAPLVGETTRRTDAESRGPRGRGSPRRWKESTGKWASLCRSRATGHAPRLPSSSLRWGLLSGPSLRPESKGDRGEKKRRKAPRSSGTHGHGIAFLTLEICVCRRAGRRATVSHPRVSLPFLFSR